MQSEGKKCILKKWHRKEKQGKGKILAGKRKAGKY